MDTARTDREILHDFGITDQEIDAQEMSRKIQRPAPSEAEDDARRWYEAYRACAYQTPLPMVVQDPSWEELPDWYKDLLVSAMEMFREGTV